MIISNITMLQIAIQKCSYLKCTTDACPTDTVMVTKRTTYIIQRLHVQQFPANLWNPQGGSLKNKNGKKNHMASI